jgi:DnaJ-class molecular chaperone
MNTDKELADELDARKRLAGHGFKQCACAKCKGTGVNLERKDMSPCFYCGGNGYTWESPIICHHSQKPL